MLPCIRSCVGKQSNHLSIACAENYAHTNDPLLFLYPRWFRIAVRHYHKQTSERPRRNAGVSKPDDDTRAGRSRANESCYTIRTDVYPASTAQEKVTSTLPVCPQRTQKLLSQSPLPKSWISSRWRPFRNDIGEVATPEKRPSRHEERKAEQLRHAKAWRNIDGLELAKSLPASQDSSFLRSIADNQYATITANASFLEWWTGTSGENIWKHNDGTGCILHIQPSSQISSSERHIMLIGTPRAREITKCYIKALETDYRKQEHMLLETHQNESHVEIQDVRMRVEQIPTPEYWSIKSFAEYVKLVVNSRTTKGIERVLYPNDDSFNKAVAKLLVALFQDKKLHPFQSSFALQHALEFFSKNTDVAFASNVIWDASKKAGIIPDTTCYNHEFSRHFRVGHQVGIKKLIAEMQLGHITPDSGTWALFFRSLRSRGEQKKFLQLPTIQKSQFSKAISREAMAIAFAETIFEPSSVNQDSVTIFERWMHRGFGYDWLTPSVITKMIEKCTETGASSSISDVLLLTRHLSQNLDTDALTALLLAVTKSGWFEDVLTLLKMQPYIIDPISSQSQVEIVFREAWNQRLTNCCRVLWHYAASHGCIRHTMMAKVSTMLAQNGAKIRSSKDSTLPLMASLIIGTDQSRSSVGGTSKSESLPGDLLDALHILRQYTKKGEERHNQLQVLHVLLERDMTAWQRFEPMKNAALLKLLHDAFEQDRTWQRQNTVANLPLGELVQKAIQIDLRPYKKPYLWTSPKTLITSARTSPEPVEWAETIDTQPSKERFSMSF